MIDVNKINPFDTHVYWKHTLPLNNKKMDADNEDRRLGTLCVIKFNGEVIAQGFAKFSKKEKQFNKETGRKVSYKRALEFLGVHKKIRLNYWLRYFNRDDANAMDYFKKSYNTWSEGHPLACYTV